MTGLLQLNQPFESNYTALLNGNKTIQLESNNCEASNCKWNGTTITKIKRWKIEMSYQNKSGLIKSYAILTGNVTSAVLNFISLFRALITWLVIILLDLFEPSGLMNVIFPPLTAQSSDNASILVTYYSRYDLKVIVPNVFRSLLTSFYRFISTTRSSSIKMISFFLQSHSAWKCKDNSYIQN